GSGEGWIRSSRRLPRKTSSRNEGACHSVSRASSATRRASASETGRARCFLSVMLPPDCTPAEALKRPSPRGCARGGCLPGGSQRLLGSEALRVAFRQLRPRDRDRLLEIRPGLRASSLITEHTPRRI